MQKINYTIIFSYGSSPLYNLFKLIMQLIWYCHNLAVLWNFIVKFEIYFFNEKNHWLHIMNIEDESWIVRYVYAFNWSALTIITGG